MSLSRLTILLGSVCFASAFVLALVGLSPGARLLESSRGKLSPTSTLDGEDALPTGPVQPLIPRCGANRTVTSPSIWRDAQAKASQLRDDKFTIAIQTYQRPKELNTTLGALLDNHIPSLLDIVIVWNEVDETPPDDYVSPYGVNVRFRRSPVNSLNERLRPDPLYRTQGVLLTDDDVYYYPDDLEFVFQIWRRYGQKSLTGGLPRCIDINDEGEWHYNSCAKNDNPEQVYAMIITNLAFSHISFLDYYSSNDITMSRIRAHVDNHTNCEDIAMNYMTSMLTGEPPLLVRGHQDYYNANPRGGISSKSGHLRVRSDCLNQFAEWFGCQPLIDQEMRIDRGVAPRRV